MFSFIAFEHVLESNVELANATLEYEAANIIHSTIVIDDYGNSKLHLFYGIPKNIFFGQN